MGNWTRQIAGCSVVLLAGCGGPLRPVALTGAETCAHCRMAVSDVHFAAQIVAAGEEPRVFDDIGCLAAAVAKDPGPSGGAVFVADHRTGEWVPVGSAVFTRVTGLDTPMSSHIVAHASEASRATDPVTAGGLLLTYEQVFPGAGGADARR